MDQKQIEVYSKEFLFSCSKEDFEYYTMDEDVLHYYDEVGIPCTTKAVFDLLEKEIEQEKNMSYQEYLRSVDASFAREVEYQELQSRLEDTAYLNFLEHHHIQEEKPDWMLAVENINRLLSLKA